MSEYKLCTKCNVAKPLADFHNDKNSKDGKTRRCRECNNEASRQRLATPEGKAYAEAYQKDRYERDPGYWTTYRRRVREADPRLAADRRLRTRFGISLEDYEAILESQGGVCAICGTMEPGGRSGEWFQVDHDHSCCEGPKSCGKCWRGLLCNRCNTWVVPVYEGTLVGDIDHLWLFTRAYIEAYADRRSLEAA